jgi:neurotransmitter:Na+ symporter, NSS family
MRNSNPVRWSSRFAFLMAAMGAAIGLANIWRFPYTAGVSGGGAFVFIYIGAVLLLALPLLVAEFMVGRRAAAPPARAMAEVALESGHSRHWGLVGVILGGAGSILTLSFYAIVGGWTMAYVVKIGSGSMQDITARAAESTFSALNGDPLTLFAWFTAFIGVTVIVSARGIHAGVEKVVRVMMPALLVMLVVMVIYAMFVGDFSAALRFLFTPDFSRVDAKIIMAAFGQAFFSLSVGATNLMAYGQYMHKSTSIPRSALIIVAADTSVALLAGLAIFPIIFAFGLEPGAGPGVVFITMPFSFGQMSGGLIFGSIFFLLLFFAALTSSIAMMESPVSWLNDRTRLNRVPAALLSGTISWVLGILAVLSLNRWANFYPLDSVPLFAGKTFFDLYDFTVTNVLLPFGGIVIAIFVGWIMKKKFSSDELYGDHPTLWYSAWLFLVRFVAPLVLLVVFWDMLN